MKFAIEEIIPITTSTFSKLMESWNGEDALALYVRYAIQAKIQRTNDTKSNDSFMKKAMNWGDTRLKNAKAVLKVCGLIETVSVRWEGGKIDDWIVRVFSAITPIEEENGSTKPISPEGGFATEWFSPPGGKRETKKGNIIKEKEKKESEEKEEAQTTVDWFIVKEFIQTIYDVLIAYKLPRKKEVPIGFAKSVLNSSDWNVQANEYGDGKELAEKIMRYACEDTFWNGKILGVGDFYKKWPTLLWQMKSKKLLTFWKKKVSSEDEAKILSTFD